VGVASIEKPEICDFDPMRISTSEIHFIISKPVSAVRADVTEVPTSRHKIL